MIGPALALGIGYATATASGGATLSRDSFTDADGTAITAHTPDVGTPTWSESSGGTAAHTIQGNALSRSDTVIRHAFMDVGTPNMKASVTVTHIENLIGLVIRRTDNLHYWELFYDYGNSGWQMSLVDGGPDTFKGPLLPGGEGTVSLEANGNTITATGPGGDRHVETDATHNTVTLAGIIVTGFAGVASTVDDWLVRET